MSMLDVTKIVTNPITRQWDPTLAFNLMMTAEQKRLLYRFHVFKNYRERIGLPIRFYGDPLASDEINTLRAWVAKLELELVVLGELQRSRLENPNDAETRV